ncbi:HlyD family type I secretion periplasmic adaptor subunit [Desulfonatronum parangueonense]
MSTPTPNTKLKDDPRPLITIGLLFVVITFGGLGAWAALTKVSAAVIAQGVVVVDTHRRTVQHLEGGIVSEILVREGQHVTRGQVLLRLQAEEVFSSYDLLAGQREHLQVIKARLEAERDRLTVILWPAVLRVDGIDPKTREVMNVQEKVFRARLTALDDQLTLHQSQIDQLQVQIQSLQEQSVANDRIIASLSQELALIEELVEGKYLDLSRLLEKQRTLDTHLSRKSQYVGDIAQARERIEELRLRSREAVHRYVQEAVNELSQVERELFELEERQRPSADQARRLEIMAPEDGIVVDLRVNTAGGVIGPREPLMDIVPGDFPLIVEAGVAVDRISQVHTGIPAELVLSAFKQRLTPRAQGLVSYVSPDRLTGPPPRDYPHYLIHIEIDQESVRQAIGDQRLLTPGMPVEVFIKTRARSILEYMIEPFTDVLRRAMTEE